MVAFDTYEPTRGGRNVGRRGGRCQFIQETHLHQRDEDDYFTEIVRYIHLNPSRQDRKQEIKKVINKICKKQRIGIVELQSGSRRRDVIQAMVQICLQAYKLNTDQRKWVVYVHRVVFVFLEFHFLSRHDSKCISSLWFWLCWDSMIRRVHMIFD